MTTDQDQPDQEQPEELERPDVSAPLVTASNPTRMGANTLSRARLAKIEVWKVLTGQVKCDLLLEVLTKRGLFYCPKARGQLQNIAGLFLF